MTNKKKIAIVTFSAFLCEALIHYNISKKEMPEITRELLRKKSEHNESVLSTLEEVFRNNNMKDISKS